MLCLRNHLSWHDSISCVSESARTEVWKSRNSTRITRSCPRETRRRAREPVKSTKTRRALTIAATWIAVRTKHSIGFIGARISPGLLVKRGTGVELEEAANIEYVRKNTSVPVPKDYCAFTRKGCTYIVMDIIRGQAFWSWWHTASADSKENVRRQLAG